MYIDGRPTMFCLFFPNYRRISIYNNFFCSLLPNINYFPGLYAKPYPEHLQILNLPSLAYHRLRGDMVEVFKLLHPQVGYDNTLDPLLPINHRTSRGNRFKLYHRRANNDLRKYSFGLRVTKMWNDLPDSVIAAL